MLKVAILLALATAIGAAQADIQVQVFPLPEDLKNLKPVAVEQSGVEEKKRLDRIDSIARRFNLKMDEKFIYTGEVKPSPSLGTLAVVYKVYPEEAQLKVVRINLKFGDARIYSVAPEEIKPYADFESSPLDTRVASAVLKPGASAVRARDYYKDWYETYQSLRVKLALKVVASDACETVSSVDLYRFNGDIFTAFCGNGMEISQTPAAIEADQPVDPSFKKWVVIRPK
ncbi:hypothetical protein PUP68_02610 [Pseudomonas chlororaphis]|uniref:hypothetical protein n=1 Tax=Pseudomonas TaxID=286 RepID=UPI000D727F43|nr:MULTISPECIES: hypothetical protein [Pseudomonas]PWY40986.1 hypothetical protein DK261_15770 [Pseudomonas sp. RW409]WDG80939.1 hypothetical protein PUP77_09630 [Pseudomonas chlororaphis]WDG86008.1 hypothetical protein PUP68_02610 [Pseudomonas chlororaphis]